MNDTLWTAKDVAAYMQVRVATVYRLPIPCIVLGKRTRRYRREDVLAYLARNARAA